MQHILIPYPVSEHTDCSHLPEQYNAPGLPLGAKGKNATRGRVGAYFCNSICICRYSITEVMNCIKFLITGTQTYLYDSIRMHKRPSLTKTLPKTHRKENPGNIWRGTPLKLFSFSVTHTIFFYFDTNPGHHPELTSDSHGYGSHINY